jgi:hypothetical protein
MTTTTKVTGINELRAEYRHMRDAGRFVFGRDWDAAVVATLAKTVNPSDATPEQWVEAARSVEIVCEKCHGRGEYHWGGTINGKPVHTGDCYQCGGSGVQDIDDMFRNRAHTLHYVNRAIA